MSDYQNENKKLWDEWTGINSSSELYQLQAFKNGQNKLNPLEISEVGDVRGKRMLHLQCHFGMDTLSWAMLGAEVTGVDFSPEAVKLAASLADELKIPAKFVCSNIYDLPSVLDDQFDIVFTSYGVLAWIPDIPQWAQLIAKFLRPGGMFYIAEFHPSGMMFDDSSSEPVWRVGYDYFNRNVMVFAVEGSYANRNAETEQRSSYEWQHTMGEIVTSLISAGLKIEFLHEHDFTVYEMFPFLETTDQKYWRIPESMKKVPLMFSIKATKDAKNA